MIASAGAGDEVEANAIANFAGKTIRKLQNQKLQEQQEAEVTADQLDVAPPVIDDPLAAKIRWVNGACGCGCDRNEQHRGLRDQPGYLPWWGFDNQEDSRLRSHLTCFLRSQLRCNITSSRDTEQITEAAGPKVSCITHALLIGVAAPPAGQLYGHFLLQVNYLGHTK